MKTFRERVQLDTTGGIARVQLVRADKHNALDLEMFRAIVDAQKAVAREKSVRVVVLSGEGVDFCTGLDVKSMFNDRSAMVKLLWKWWPGNANLAQQVSVGWRRMPIPVIAALQGRCWGGGLQIALGADFRLAHPKASLSIMEGKWGLIPDMGGTLALRDIMPRDQAMKLAMTAEIFDANKALELGVVTAVCEDLDSACNEWAAALCERSPDALAAVKRLYRITWNGTEESALARESIYQVRVLAGANQRIAVQRQMGKDISYRP
jgi:enoyl-CoA hydratase/carnithine racemase